MATKTKTVFRVHVVMWKIEMDENGDETDSDIIGEEDIKDYPGDFDDEAKAQEVFNTVAGL